MVGAFTMSPVTGVVPASGQVLVTVECVADQVGHMSEVSRSHRCYKLLEKMLKMKIIKKTFVNMNKKR